MLQFHLKNTEEALSSFDKNNPVDCQKLDVISEIIDSQTQKRLPKKPETVTPEIWQYCIRLWKSRQ